MNFFQGYRTQISLALAAICQIARTMGVPIPPGTEELLMTLAGFFFALKVQKANKDNTETVKKIVDALQQHKPESGK